MKLTPEQLASWYEITVRHVFKNPSFAMQTSAPLKKSDISELKQAINDLLAGFSGDFELDRALRAAGLPDFEQMEHALRRKERAILRRGKIRDEEELYIVNEVLAGSDSDLPTKSIAKLGVMITEYAKGKTRA